MPEADNDGRVGLSEASVQFLKLSNAPSPIAPQTPHVPAKQSPAEERAYRSPVTANLRVSRLLFFSSL
jgi:hypothetical protein